MKRLGNTIVSQLFEIAAIPDILERKIIIQEKNNLILIFHSLKMSEHVLKVNYQNKSNL